MKRRPISALLFVLLLVAVGLMVWQRSEGPAPQDGFAIIDRPHRLESVAFRLDEPTRVLVEATGSVGADGGLETYAWVLDARTRQVTWRMSRGRSRKKEGTLVAQRDTLRLPAGTYELFYTPHGRTGNISESNIGRRMFDRRYQWRNDEGQWYVVLRSLDTGTQPVRIDDADALPVPEALVWRSSRDAQGSNEETVLEVASPAPAVVHATFIASEIGAGAVARIERLTDGTTLWEASPSQARPAGGAPHNRRVEADIRLLPGLYRLVARTSGDHGPRYWQANPPDDPRAWGLTLLRRSGTIRPLDLWTGRAPLVRLRGDQPAAELSGSIKVSQPATVAVYGMGEFASGADDYAWLENDANGERIWEQNRENTVPAGGDDKNREGQRVLTLAPGTYTLHFHTDDSHHLGDFNSDPPTHEERYGAALFLLGPEGAAQAAGAPTSTSTETPEAELTEPPAPPEPPKPLAAVAGAGVPPPPAERGALAALVRMENNERRSAGFVLRGDQAIRIYATGEFSGASDYDAAWITNANGETIWRMSEATLRHAGGDDRNRYCDEIVRLRSGTYTVHYTTDGSHAFGNFGDAPPTYPDAWGVIVASAAQ